MGNALPFDFSSSGMRFADMKSAQKAQADPFPF
jgi:hypothetical protein